MKKNIRKKYLDKEYINLLTKNICDGDIESGSKLYDIMKYPLLKHIKEIIKNDDDAEDILHEVFLSYLKKTKRKIDYKNCFGLLFKITDRQIYKCIKKNKVQDLIKSIDSQYTNDQIYNDELNYEISIVLSMLTPRQNKIIKLRAKGYTNKEVADMLNLSLSTVRREEKKIKYLNLTKK